MSRRPRGHRAARHTLPLLLVVASASRARAQVVEVGEGPFVPSTQLGNTPGHGPDPTRFVRVYANVLPSDVSQMLTVPNSGPIMPDASRYSAPDFVCSVTSRVLMPDKDESQSADLSGSAS